MIKGTLAPGHREKNQEKIIQEKEWAMDKIIKDFEESSRKLDKVRSLLHTAGNIEVGNTPHEVVEQKRTYNLLHYRPLVSKPAKTPLTEMGCPHDVRSTLVSGRIAGHRWWSVSCQSRTGL